MKKGFQSKLFVLIILLIIIASSCDFKKDQIQNTTSKSIERDTTVLEKENILKSEKTSLLMFIKTIDNGWGENCNNRIILFVKSGAARAFDRVCNDEYAIFDFYEGVLTHFKKSDYYEN